MPDLLIENWYGMVAPAGTPPAIVAALNRIANEAMRDPAVKEKLADQGLTLVGDTPEHFRELYRQPKPAKWAQGHQGRRRPRRDEVTSVADCPEPAFSAAPPCADAPPIAWPAAAAS